MHTSCVQEQKNNGFSINPEDAETTIVIPDLDDEIPDSFDSLYAFYYSEHYSEIRYLTLETRPDAILSEITEIKKAKDSYIVFDQANGLIVRYDLNGSFLNMIGQRGNATNEYNDPLTIDYNKYSDQVFVLDGAKNKILIYNMDGSLDRRMESYYAYGGMKILDENHLIFYYIYRPDKTENGYGYNYLVSTMDGEECFRFEEVPAKGLSFLPYYKNVFIEDDVEGLCCRSPFSNIVYSVTSEGVTPKYRICPPKESWAICNPKNISDVEKGGSIWTKSSLSTMFLYGGTVEMNSRLKDGIVCTCLLDKNGNMQRYFFSVNDMDGYVKSNNILAIIDNEKYCVIDPGEFEDLYNKKKDDSSFPCEKLEFIERMSNEVNPIIQICTPK